MFKCPLSHCIPTRMVCDGSKDCAQGEDERHCENPPCPGLLRCRKDSSCVHPTDLCDGIIHCLYSKDDEKLCQINQCPKSCVCRGSAVMCQHMDLAHEDISPSIYAMKLQSVQLHSKVSLKYFAVLVYLYFNHCNIDGSAIGRYRFVGLYNLQQLLVLNCRIRYISNYAFSDLKQLKLLDIHGNHIADVHQYVFSDLQYIQELNLSRLSIHTLHSSPFQGLDRLRKLDLSHNYITVLPSDLFIGLENAQIIDCRHNLIQYIGALTLSHTPLALIYFDKTFHCCYANSHQSCSPSPPDKTICRTIIKELPGNLVVAGSSVMIILGSAVNLRLMMSSSKSKAYLSFLTHLVIADMICILYTSSLGLFSLLYRNNYIYVNSVWPNSYTCSTLHIGITISFTQSNILSFMLVFSQLIATKFIFTINQLLSVKNTLYIEVVCWAVSVTTASINFIYKGEMQNSCFPFLVDKHASRIRVAFVSTLIVVYLGSILGIIVMYKLLICAVRNSQKRIGNVNRSHRVLHSLRRRAVIVSCVEMLIWLSLIAVPIITYYYSDVHSKIITVMISCYSRSIGHLAIHWQKGK